MIGAADWYDENPDFRNFYQGDVLTDFPFPNLPTFLPANKQDVWGVLRPRYLKGRSIAEVVRNLPNDLIGRAAKDWPDVWATGSPEFVIAACEKRTVMVVSRSCDIDKNSRKHFLVAPVATVDSLQTAQRTEDKLRDLRNNDIFHWFYLPANGGIPESFADLSQIVPLHRSFFDDALLNSSLAARLSARGTAELQSSLSDFYGTKFGFASEDACPQSARYACAACFYSGQPTPTAMDCEEGLRFGDCDYCGDGALWIKVPH